MKITKEKLQVNSSAIISMSYKFEEKTLLVKFIGGRKYVFNNVSTEIFFGLKHSESIGKFFNKMIKGNYKFETL